MNINDGKKHTLIFSGGGLFLDGVELDKDKEIVFEIQSVKVDPPILSINVSDSVSTKEKLN
jgi:hypothetical protein